ncbi:MAG: PilZ domain-containing protein [Syntrophobacteraceae bacterium]
MRMRQSDRRRFTRVPYTSEAILTGPDIRLRGTVENLSLNGVLMKVPEKPEVGLSVEVEIFLAEPASDVSVVLSGTVVRQTADAAAVEFSGMYLDDYERLRDVIALSLGDRKKVIEEFLEYMAK